MHIYLIFHLRLSVKLEVELYVLLMMVLQNAHLSLTLSLSDEETAKYLVPKRSCQLLLAKFSSPVEISSQCIRKCWGYLAHHPHLGTATFLRNEPCLRKKLSNMTGISVAPVSRLLMKHMSDNCRQLNKGAWSCTLALFVSKHRCWWWACTFLTNLLVTVLTIPDNCGAAPFVLIAPPAQ